VTVFAFDSGFVSLDLLATVHRRSDRRIELMNNVDDLRTWADEAHLPIQQNLIPDDLDMIVELRESIYALAVAGLNAPVDESARQLLNSAAQQPSHLRQLGRDGRVITQPGDIRTFASSLARDALVVIGEHRDHVKECADEHCTTLFVDTSRGSRRRWCSMQRCGTRSKVSAHRQRLQQNAT